jgi:transposase-like protein
MSEKPKPGKVYSEAERAEILEYYRTHGGRPTARHFHISTNTLYRWRKQAGATTEVAGKEATEAASAALANKRAKLKETLLDKVVLLLGRITESTPPRDCRDIGWTTGVLFDKLRIEGGEPTARQEVSHEYPDIAALSDDELEAAIVREAESITRREPEA